MLITFVCNQNLARSQILSSVFSKLYPEHEFQSAGLIAVEGSVLPSVIQEIYEDWGLPLEFQKARNLFQNFDEIRKSEIIVSINENVSGEIQALGFEGKLVNLEELAKELGLILRDPQLMPRQRCATELAKYVRVVAFFFRAKLFLNASRTVTALTPETDLQRRETLKIAIAKYGLNSTIVMADFLVPQVDLISEFSIQTSVFEINSLTSQIKINSGTDLKTILIPSNSALWPARTYLSSSWRGFCEDGSRGLTTLITPPLRSGSMEIAESHLAAIFADKVEMITETSVK